MRPLLSSQEMRLLPLYIHHAAEHSERKPSSRDAGFAVYSQLTLCTSGSGIFIDSNKTKYNIKKGDIFYFSPGAPHSYYPTCDDWQVKFILFGGSDAECILDYFSFAKSGIIPSLGNDEFEILDEMFDEICKISNNRNVSHISLSDKLYKLIEKLGQCIVANRNNSFDKKKKLIAPCLELMQSDFHRDLSMSEIAKCAEISPNYMNALFKEIYDATPQSLLIGIRIDYAKNILAHDHNVLLDELAENSGFSNSSYFCRIFKKYTGMTPKEYKQYYSILKPSKNNVF